MKVKAQENKPNLLKLVDYDHPLLRQVLETVKFPLSAEDKQIIKNMRFSIQRKQLKKANATWDAAAGMAANQWGINKRIFIFCPDSDADQDLQVIINPKYEPISDSATDTPSEDHSWESCFSVPLTTGDVRRYTRIKVTYQNEEGKTIVQELSGWPARVWQHENDHLDGILYEDPKTGKCVNRKEFASKEEINAFFDQKSQEMPCPCGYGKSYHECCRVFLKQEAFPKTPEALMRSRYTAYAVGYLDYIRDSMRLKENSPTLLKFSKKTKNDNQVPTWIGLNVINAYYDQNNLNIGFVEFIAEYKIDNVKGYMHELSEFNFTDGRWYYVDGKELA